MSNRRTIQSIPRNILQNNLRQITDFLDNSIVREENFRTNIMRTSDIRRQHRHMATRLERMNERLQHIDQLLNAYIAVVVHRMPPPPQVRSRMINEAFRVFQNSNMWQHYPDIVQSERQRLTELSDRLNDLELQVCHIIFYLHSLSSSR